MGCLPEAAWGLVFGFWEGCMTVELGTPAAPTAHGSSAVLGPGHSVGIGDLSCPLQNPPGLSPPRETQSRP